MAQVVRTFGSRVVALVLTFLTSMITARELGVDGRGQLAVMLAVPGLFSVVAAAGLDTANLFFAGRSGRAFVVVVRWSLVHSGAGGAALAGSWAAAAAVWPQARLGLDEPEFLLALGVGPIVLANMLVGVAEAGRGRVFAYNASYAGTMAMYLLSLGLLAALGGLSVRRSFAAFAGGQLLMLLLLLSWSRPWRRGDGAGVPLGDYSRYGGRAYLPNVLQFLMLRIDIPMIAVLAGSTQVGVYSVALPIAESLLLLPVAVGLILLPRVAQSDHSAHDVAAISRSAFLATAAGAVGLAAAAPLLVPVLFGPSFGAAEHVLWALLPGVAVFSVGRIVQTQLAGREKFRPTIRASVAGLLVTLGGEVALVPALGALGAGVATLAGYVAFTTMMVLTSRRLAETPPLALFLPPPRRGRQGARSGLSGATASGTLR